MIYLRMRLISRKVKTAQRQVRAVKGGLEARHGVKLPRDNPAVPWLLEHAVQCINWIQVYAHGKKAYHRIKSRGFNMREAGFGECVWHLRPRTVGMEKWDCRWEKGVWYGIIVNSNGRIVATPDGVFKAGDFRRMGSRQEKSN